MEQSFCTLEKTVVACRKCPRLVAFRESVPPRASFRDQTFWRHPLPGFGDPNAWLLILGLAPAAQGGNRTGRIFTGDPSASFLMNTLHQEGFANQPTSESRTDGLVLSGCYMTVAVKCVPPKNRPTREEFNNCSGYLANEIALLTNLSAVLALGKLAFDAYLRFLKEVDAPLPKATFAHGTKCAVQGWPTLYASYHPSPQNTYTGKLTEKMFRTFLQRIKRER